MTVMMTGMAVAQENLDSGKSGAQLFASDCTACHKTPNEVANRKGDMFGSGTVSFLREHYTASKDTAAVIAAYIDQVGKAGGPAPAARPKAAAKKKPTDAQPGEDGKTSESKTDESKSEAKPVAKKPAEKKPAEAKSSEAKPSETKPAESKPAETKSSEIKGVDVKPAAEKSN